MAQHRREEENAITGMEQRGERVSKGGQSNLFIGQINGQIAQEAPVLGEKSTYNKFFALLWTHIHS